MKIFERFERVAPLIDVSKDINEFVIVRILQRRKDNPDLEYPEKQLKVYSFYNWAEYHRQAERIVEICDLNNARAYIRMNTQNALDISLRMQKEIIDNILNGCPRKNEGVWNSITGKGGSKDWWVIDIDTEHLSYVTEIKQELINHYRNRGTTLPEDLLLINNPTKSGVHLICKPFDTRILDRFNKELSKAGKEIIIIQKDANTVLYIGNEK